MMIKYKSHQQTWLCWHDANYTGHTACCTPQESVVFYDSDVKSRKSKLSDKLLVWIRVTLVHIRVIIQSQILSCIFQDFFFRDVQKLFKLMIWFIVVVVNDYLQFKPTPQWLNNLHCTCVKCALLIFACLSYSCTVGLIYLFYYYSRPRLIAWLHWPIRRSRCS